MESINFSPYRAGTELSRINSVNIMAVYGLVPSVAWSSTATILVM